MKMGKIALVTGGSRGIGAATVKALAQEGYDVAVNYNTNGDAAEKVAGEARAAGVRAITVRADVGRDDQVAAMFETVDRELGILDALVNNAGINGRPARIDELTADEIIVLLHTNVLGPMLCSREAIKRMSTKYGGAGGGIVNVSSGSAYIGNPGRGVLYAVSKGGVNSLLAGLSQEVAGEGVRVNNVAPGMTQTDMVPSADPDLIANIPMGRLGQPMEIAEAIVWLLSNKATFVAGANIRIAGGRP
jgi:NAD(P)-dependent dehydrogenase (short-subunit alcohol dehydrogenase family)